MFTFAIRSMVVVAATAAAIVVWFNLGNSNAVSGAPLADVLAGLRTAKTLELRDHQGWAFRRGFGRRAGLVRYEDSPHNYRIAVGSAPVANRRNDQHFDHRRFSLVPQSQGTDRSVGFARSRRNRRVAAFEVASLGQGSVRGSRVRCVFGPIGRQKWASCRIEAFTDPTTNRLLGITARPIGPAAAIGPPLAELQLVAINPPIDESEIRRGQVARPRMAEIGKISDAQGSCRLAADAVSALDADLP